MEIAVLALGCFWGPEIKFSKIEGIIKTEVGYCGGNSTTTTYKEVCTGSTNHAEVVKLDFDEKIITYEKILKIFFHEFKSVSMWGRLVFVFEFLSRSKKIAFGICSF